MVGLTDGLYCVLLQTGLKLNSPSSGFVAAAIAQTGTVPASAESVIFNAGLISSANLTNLVVTFNGTPLLLAVITTQPNYVVIGGDISQFAGRSGECDLPRPYFGFSIHLIHTHTLIIIGSFWTTSASPASRCPPRRSYARRR